MFGSSSALSSVIVSAKAPDILQTEITAAGPQMRVNVFLHQVTHNAAWRNAELPSLGADGSTQLSSPPRPGSALPDDRLRNGGLGG